MFWTDLEEQGDAVALVETGGARLTYAGLAAAADNAFPPALDTRDLLLLQLDNTIPAVVAYLAALRRGCPVIVVNSGDEQAAGRLIETFHPAYRWSPETSWQAVSRTTGPTLHPDLAIMLSTSGTTGATKLVRLSAEAVDANARAIADYLAIGPDDRAITTLPPGYSYGLSVINSHLAAGASLLLNDLSVVDPAFHIAAAAGGATCLAGVPYTYELLERSGGLGSLPATIRTLTQAGGKLPMDRAQRIGAWAAASGRRFFLMYGQTEATARIAYLPPALLQTHADCIGRAIPGGELTIVDPDGDAPATGIGELVYRGPNVMMGYAEHIDDLGRGYDVVRLRTGDLAERAGPDLFRITGRKSRFLKLFGLRIALDEVEREAAGQGWTVIATGTDERLILASEDAEIGAAASRFFTERYVIPAAHIAFVRVAQTPRLPSGKIDYSAIRAMAAAADPSADHASGEDVQARLLEVFGKNFPRAAITPADSFLSLGGDSLNYITVSIRIEELTGVLPDQWEALSIAELAQAAAPVRRRWFIGVEPSLFARALAPLMIVANHAGNEALRGGAVMLLMVAGQNFARFSRNDLVERRFGRVTQALLVNVLLPFWLVLLAFEGGRDAIAWQDFALISNWTGYYGPKPFQMWFVQVLAQAFLLYAALALAPPIRRAWRDRPFAISMTLLAGAAILALCHVQFWEGVLRNYGRELTWQLWLFAAGVSTNYARTWIQRTAVLLTVMGIALLTYGADPSRLIAATGGIALLLSWRKLPVPMMLLPVATVIGSSSLFIYMLHGRAPTGSPTAHWPVDIVRIGLGVLFGVIAWMLYEQLLRIARGLLARRVRVTRTSLPV